MIDLTDARHSCQQHTSRLEYSVQGSDGSADIINEMQSLSEDNAIEGFGFYVIRIFEVGHDRSVQIVFGNMQHIAMRDTRTAESTRVRIITDFQNPPLNISGIGGEERFDIVAIDRSSSIKPEYSAYGGQPAKIAEAG
jgi:hypothetical protein